VARSTGGKSLMIGRASLHARSQPARNLSIDQQLQGPRSTRSRASIVMIDAPRMTCEQRTTGKARRAAVSKHAVAHPNGQAARAGTDCFTLPLGWQLRLRYPGGVQPEGALARHRCGGAATCLSTSVLGLPGQANRCGSPSRTHVLVRRMQATAAAPPQQLTTMPRSAFSFSSTVLSSTRFMNWSKPRSTPVTWRFAFSLTAAGVAAGSGIVV